MAAQRRRGTKFRPRGPEKAMHLPLRLLPILALLLVFSGCASYVPPGPKADLKLFAPDDIQQSFALRPASPFPAAIACVRAQGPRYTNLYLDRNGGSAGSGRYTVVTVREAGEQNQIDRIAALPEVAGVTGINRLLLPDKLETDRELRAAAARLQADLLLLYTFETAFFDHNMAKPLSVISLGLSPTRKITATTTVSALLIDTRTGYIHGTFEATEMARTLSTSWGSSDSADEVRRATEQTAFAKLVDDFVATWPRIAARKEGRPAAPPPAGGMPPLSADPGVH